MWDRSHRDLMARPVAAVIFTLLLLLSSSGISVQAQSSDWEDNEIDPSTWTDGPELEGSPMDTPRPGDPVLVIEVSYRPGHFQSVVSGEIYIELFPEWAPITVSNMIQHVEIGLYDGIFFHRVIDDFVTQAGDPTCQAVGAYPATSPQCGSGGTGETIPIEFNDNLSHVDGAIGMARGQELDSADSQWYIAETEAHGLDKENSSSGGYATFGVVRQGMSHVRAIALVPTSDDPSGSEPVTNPASSAGRPIYEVHISKIEMVGVVASSADSSDEADSGFMTTVSETSGFVFTVFFWLWSIALLIGSAWTIRNRGFFSKDSDIEAVVDAWLDSDS